MTRSPNDIDKAIGTRIRLRRIALRLSQGDLAAALGCTFQQMQKYENGKNRLSSGNLVLLLHKLDLAPSVFFKAYDNGAAAGEPEFSDGAIKLARDFDRLPTPELQTAARQVISQLAKLETPKP